MQGRKKWLRATGSRSASKEAFVCGISVAIIKASPWTLTPLLQCWDHKRHCLLQSVLSPFAFMPWQCSSCSLLPPRQPALSRSALSKLFKICLAQAEKQTRSQAGPNRRSYCMLFSCLCLGYSVQPLQVCLFFSLSHTQSCDVSAVFVQGSAPFSPIVISCPSWLPQKIMWIF